MALDPRIQCEWEEGVWPVERKDEPDSRNLEDIRKRLWLLGWPGAGWHTLAVEYGTYSGDAYVPYDATHWEGLWGGYEEPTPAQPGWIIVLYKDVTETQDLYVNCVEMNDETIDANPPIQTGVLDSTHWRLAPNPNLYSHWNYNAGKPAIGADGRWRFNHHAEDLLCDPFLLEYVSQSRTRDWLPRQVNPYRQLAPTKEGAVVTQRHNPVEQAKSNVTGVLGTSWDRSLSTDELCVKPERQSEYVLGLGEPYSTYCETCEDSNQCAADPKMNDAYQAYVIGAVEKATQYVKAVDAEWKVTWLAFQLKTLWAVDVVYAYKAIVYLVSEEDVVMYICYAGHTATADNMPGTVGGEAYWKTPPYQPDYFYYQPVYAHLGGDITGTALAIEADIAYSWFWGCNDSAFELCLRDLGKTESLYPAWSATHGIYLVGDVAKTGDVCKQCKLEHTAAADKALDNATYWEDVTEYDWWWDTGHPAIPWWLYKSRVYELANWPEPRGCWRRTWKHSAGRPSDLMWPGEKGNPPGYNPMKFIVTQVVYDTIPEAYQKYYAVVDVEGLHAAAYGEDEEALIAARHDPILIRHVEYEAIDYPHPMYEMHHDIINDLRNVLLQLHLTDDNGVSAPLYRYVHSATEKVEATPLAAYATARGAVAEPAETETYDPVSEADPVGDVGGDTGYPVSIRYNGPPPYSDDYGASVSMIPMLLEIYKTGEMLAALYRSYILYRVGYRGIETPDPGLPGLGDADGCEVGFGDKTLIAEPESDWKIDYVRLEFAEGETEIVKSGSTWTEYHYFDLNLVSGWPEMGEEGFFGSWEGTAYNETRMWYREISVCRLPSGLTSLPIVFETDWNLVLESVFEEDESNAIIL